MPYKRLILHKNKALKYTTLILFFILSLINYSCGKSSNVHQDDDVFPDVSVSDISIERTDKVATGFFYISLNTSIDREVTCDYTFKDGTAQAGRDYTQKSGKLAIPANQRNATIEVNINPSYLREPNLVFQIELSNGSNCILKKSVGICTIITENGNKLSTSQDGYTTPSMYPGKKLVWSDEFSSTSLDITSWNQEIGNGVGGWGNNELQYYTNSSKNTFVSDGNLVIEARKESIDGFQYTSGRMTTKAKREFAFGRIDIRAKLPKGKGIWPALWMLGSNISTIGWPSCGEIDIMELIGSIPNETNGTLHWKGVAGHEYKGDSSRLPSGDFSQQFHVFSLVWEQNSIAWLLDDVEFYRMTSNDFGNAVYPFNAPQFFIFNVAVGGNWPCFPDDNTQFPQRMFVDYVRVFQ